MIHIIYNGGSSRAPKDYRRSCQKMVKTYFKPIGLEAVARPMDVVDFINFDSFGIDIQSELDPNEIVFFVVYDDQKPHKYFTNEDLLDEDFSREDMARSFISRKRRRVEMEQLLTMC